jgi:acetylornithine deacetylase/succinyl-diaminopimelate desuccinylase-like protein
VAEPLHDEVVELTRGLIRIDTSNPPGRETPAAEFLAGYLRRAGVEPELVGPDPERLNLVARIEGRGEGPSLMLMAHTDVVPAPSEDWTVPPFEGVLRDGRVIGRGAVDMKNELAARVVAFAALARDGEPPAGDVVLVAEADEERNTAGVGMPWLVRERPDLRSDFALNEGGGVLLELDDGRRLVTISVGEKEVTSLRLRVFGRAGHASIPSGEESAPLRAARAVERLVACPGPERLTPTTERAMEILDGGAGNGGTIDRAARRHPWLTGMVPAMTRMTVTPTGLRTHEPANVIPPFVDVICDCRAVPGQGMDEIREHVDRALGEGIPYELDLLEPVEGGTESAIDTPLYRVCEEYVADRLPGARLLPIVAPGFTDSHWVRREHGTVAYGFAPVFSMDPVAYEEAAHGADEAIEVADLVEMAEFHRHALTAGLGE